MNSTLFLEYINTIFIPYLNELRESEDVAECEAVLLMDNYLPHMEDAAIAVLTRERIRVITFTSHTTHIFQVLDTVLFGALKNKVLVSRNMRRSNHPPHSYSSSIITSNRRWWKSISGALLQPSGLLMTLSKIRMDCSSIRKSSDKIAASRLRGALRAQYAIGESVEETSRIEI
jgi:hypothetical protein